MSWGKTLHNDPTSTAPPSKAELLPIQRAQPLHLIGRRRRRQIKVCGDAHLAAHLADGVAQCGEHRRRRQDCRLADGLGGVDARCVGCVGEEADVEHDGDVEGRWWPASASTDRKRDAVSAAARVHAKQRRRWLRLAHLYSHVPFVVLRPLGAHPNCSVST
jgi:hypothetical protein